MNNYALLSIAAPPLQEEYVYVYLLDFDFPVHVFNSDDKTVLTGFEWWRTPPIPVMTASTLNCAPATILN